MYTPFCVWLRVPARGLIRVSWLALRLPEGFGPYEDDEYLETASDVIWSDDFFIDVAPTRAGHVG